jgi:hypothetical protein
MDTIVRGVFITTRGWLNGPSVSRPAVRTRPNGVFVLRMPLVNRLSDGRNERYIVVWEGPQAQNWWQAHSDIGSGQPLEMELVDPVIGDAPTGSAIHARVVSCTLLPRPSPPTTRVRLGAEVQV